MSEIIPLKIVGDNLKECLDNLFTSEVIERNCSSCPAILARKEMETVIEPNILIFQIKRYEYDSDTNEIRKKQDSLTIHPILKLASGSSYSLCSIALDHPQIQDITIWYYTMYGGTNMCSWTIGISI